MSQESEPSVNSPAPPPPFVEGENPPPPPLPPPSPMVPTCSSKIVEAAASTPHCLKMVQDPDACMKVIRDKFQRIANIIGKERTRRIVLQYIGLVVDHHQQDLPEDHLLIPTLKIIHQHYLALLSKLGNIKGTNLTLSCFDFEIDYSRTISSMESNYKQIQRNILEKTDDSGKEQGHSDYYNILKELWKIQDDSTLEFVVCKIGPTKLQELEQTWKNLKEQRKLETASSSSQVDHSSMECTLLMELCRALCESDEPKSHLVNPSMT
ncbi:hypothetical protein Dsin_022865 [Dipteronia sinensis]|uniref:Uncharacterized protein n=1 Tax=Dipteronia sinensis TaxID=43782 RepID=A0AAE0E055_9ROSI|nr:hypothetical protein Dsin_022865 [Dipteronia sinensis]